MAAQLRAAGIEVKIDPQSYPNGRFPSCMTLREIRSNCGNLQDQALHARLLNSSGLFLECSWVTLEIYRTRVFREGVRVGMVLFARSAVVAADAGLMETEWGKTAVRGASPRLCVIARQMTRITG